MPRFYFHFKEDGYIYVDDVGHELPVLEDAEQEATITAAALLRDAAVKGKYDDICVEDGFALVTVRASMKVARKP